MTAIPARAEVDAVHTLRLAVACDLPPGPVDVVVQLPTSANGEEMSPDLVAAIASLPLLTDEELWQAARRRFAVEAAERLEALHLRQQRAPIGEAERAEMIALTDQYEWAAFIRAKAVEQLLARGHDVSGLLAP